MVANCLLRSHKSWVSIEMDFKMNKIKVLAFLFMFIPCLVRAEIIDGIAAIVNGEIVTISDIHERLGSAAIASINEIPSEVMRESQRYRVYSDILDQLIEDALIRAEADKLEMRISESDIDRMVEEVKSQNNLTDEQLSAVLEAEGLTMLKYRETMRTQIMRQRIMGVKIHSRVKVEDEDIKNYYAQNINVAMADKRVKVRHILLLLPPDAGKEEEEKTYAIMKSIRERILAGEEFGILAKEYSADPSREYGGELPEFGKGEFIPEFERAAMALKEGELSDIVRTEFGFHLIQGLKVQRPEVLPLKEVYDKIKNLLFREKLEEELKVYLAELRREAQIEIKLVKP